MLSFISELGRVFALVINFIFKIEVENGVTLGQIVYVVVAIGVFFALIHGSKGASQNDTYQPRHAYAPKHARKE